MVRFFKPDRSRSPRDAAPDELAIDSLSSDGRGVARHGGKVVFVSGALPQERVAVSHYRRQKRFSECATKAVLRPSVSRVEPRCSHFVNCGGCQLQHMAADKQLHCKQENFLRQLKHQQQLVPERVLPAIQSQAYQYRSRVRFVINGRQRLCLREKSSDKLVEVKNCPVLVPALQQLLPRLAEWLATLNGKPGVSHIELVDAEPRPAVVIRHLKPLPESSLKALRNLESCCAVYLQGEKAGELRNLDGFTATSSELCYRLRLQDLTIYFSPVFFTQVNRQVNEALVEAVVDWLQPTAADSVGDLFCGVGNFTLAIARRAGKVLGVEVEEHMVVQAHHNGAINHLKNTEFAATDLENPSLAQRLLASGCNKILIDPPRSGARRVCEQLVDTAVELLVYVSCNPTSFARDAAILVSGGFRFEAVRVLDMFPQTAHLEVMARFVRD